MKNNKGITLIALIITIIVLLILAGVSIAMLTGDNGILAKATQAKLLTQKTAKEEQQYLMEIEKQLEISSGEVKKVTDTTPGILDGSGIVNESIDDPYKIESIEDLVAFVNNVNKGERYSGKVVRLTENLDLKSTNSYVDSNTTSFGDYNEDGQTKGLIEELTDTSRCGFKFVTSVFEGTLDGNGKQIKNIYAKPDLIESYNYYGFIGELRGTVKNLTLQGTLDFIKTNDAKNNDDIRLGTIVGKSSGKIINCTSNIELNVSLNNIEQKIEETLLTAGGIAGQNTKTGTIDNCRNYGAIYLEESINLIDSTYYKLDRIGGIVGSNEGKAQNLINYANIDFKSTRLGQSDTRVNAKVGGIAGLNKSNNISIIQNAVNNGKITGIADDGVYIGGIVGDNEDGSLKIENVANKAEIQGKADMSRLKIAGISAEGYGTINKAYNVGKIINNSETNYVGAIVGDVHSKLIINECKYLASSATGAGQNNEISGVEKVEQLSDSDIINILNEGVKQLNQIDNNLIEWVIRNDKINLKD